MPDHLNQFLDTLFNLNVGVTGQGVERHERPHKPLLILSIIQLIDQGKTSPDRVVWDRKLVRAFKEAFKIVKRRDDDDTPKYPFFHLKSDGFWTPHYEKDSTLLSAPPSRSQLGEVSGTFSPEVIPLLKKPATRRKVRDLIISRYFPDKRTELLVALYGDISKDKEASEAPSRSSAFKDKVISIYDHQCAACGMRIKLPNNKVSFVDAAHLVPFSESYNDHPSNGMALCKHHHWAVDRHLLSPGPDGNWHVSNMFDHRRSNAERDMLSLHKTPIILPNDEAYYPSSQSLKWRLERLHMA